MPNLAPFQSLEHYRALGFRAPADSDDLAFEAADEQHVLHQKFKPAWGFFLPTAEVMDRLARLVKVEIGLSARILDAGAGSGFLSKELCRLGVNTFAVDKCEYENRNRKYGYPIIDVHQRDALGDAVKFVAKGFDAILMTWPPYDWSFAHDIAKAMLPGQWLIYEGEFYGCCANNAFFECVADEQVWERRTDLGDWLDEVHVAFSGLEDHWAVWRKK